MAFIRLMAIMGAVLTVVYVFLRLYFVARHRETLAQTPPAMQRARMAAYERWLRPRLLIGVYGIPFAILVLIVYFTNFA